METIDYIFILCGIAAVFAILVTIIHPLIPKDLMMESKEINIKRGKKNWLYNWCYYWIIYRLLFMGKWLF